MFKISKYQPRGRASQSPRGKHSEYCRGPFRVEALRSRSENWMRVQDASRAHIINTTPQRSFHPACIHICCCQKAAVGLFPMLRPKRANLRYVQRTSQIIWPLRYGTRCTVHGTARHGTAAFFHASGRTFRPSKSAYITGVHPLPSRSTELAPSSTKRATCHWVRAFIIAFKTGEQESGRAVRGSRPDPLVGRVRRFATSHRSGRVRRSSKSHESGRGQVRCDPTPTRPPRVLTRPVNSPEKQSSSLTTVLSAACILH